jgi:UDP-N-acetyl-2-amino-2-deoxyglucuronate dehydrogenase
MAIRVGVIGLGIGKVHLLHLSQVPHVRIAAAADPIPDLRTWAEDAYGVPAYAGASELLEREKLDAVTIATPPRLHREQVEQAAARGLHVFLEKPIAPSLQDADAIIAACERAGVILQIGFKKRFAPAFVWIKAQEDTLGSPQVVSYRFQQFGRIEKDWFWDEADGGGPLIEHAAHPYDVLAWFLGEPVRIYAETDNYFHPRRTPVEDQAVATIRFASGAIATLAAGMSGAEQGVQHDPGEVVSMVCDRGVAEVRGWRDTPYLARTQSFSSPTILERRFEAGSGFAEEFADFIACIEQSHPPLVGGVDGRRALQIGLAIKESGRTHAPVVLAGAEVTP